MNVITILCDTLRRDHCSPYTGGKPLNEATGPEEPDWVVPTPNMARLAERGTVFTNAYCGSHPCMPARRDIYTGRYEFLERGWGPLEEDDLDLPRQVSGPPNHSITRMKERGERVSQLISDHFHLWEQGAGNYHMGYTGFEFIRGIEADNLYTDPLVPGEDFDCPPNDRMGKNERHFRNKHILGGDKEENSFPARTFGAAIDWVKRNHEHEDFYLHIDSFPPHEPWDPPEELLKQFWPDGYDVDFEWQSAGPYARWQEAGLTEEQKRFTQARYAATVVLVDRWLGKLFDTLDELDLWKDTLVVLTADHGTYNGDRGRLGKLQTHLHDPISRVPFIAAHPTHGHGEQRDQLVQLVDLFPTTLAAVDRPLPQMPEGRPLHGVNILPLFEDPQATTRDYAINGMFGGSVSITDGRWILHQPSVEDNQPLYWHGYCLAKFIPYDLGPYENGRRHVSTNHRGVCSDALWLSDKQSDPGERTNLVDQEPDELRRLQQALRQTLADLQAPPEQAERLGLST